MLFTGMIDQDKKQKNKNYWKKNGVCVCVCVCVWKTLRLNNDEVLGKNTHIYNKTLYNKQAHSHTHTHTQTSEMIYTIHGVWRLIHCSLLARSFMLYFPPADLSDVQMVWAQHLSQFRCVWRELWGRQTHTAGGLKRFKGRFITGGTHSL